VETGRQDQLQYQLFNMSGRRYYTIDKGNGLVAFFMLDTTELDTTQLSWLENSLRASRARWKIALFHHPIYSSGKKHGSNLKQRAILEPLFTRYNVHVVFSGHDHFYQRTPPQNGIQYFITGAGGKTRRGGVDLNCPLRAVSFDEDNHFMLIELEEDEVRFQAISETGAEVDKGVIKQA
ncbi:MAG TPA: metallophosphoesterase, partial [Blastocatellia bacterium]|nr:metallophosphoesterase [Blastocatellia bacterium]